MQIKAIEWIDNQIQIIDQTCLPEKKETITLTNVDEVAEAIKKLRIRGAPAIGVAGAMGLAMGMLSNTTSQNDNAFFNKLEQLVKYLNSTRPTAVNLSWALHRMKQISKANQQKSIPEIQTILIAEAQKIAQEEADRSENMGRLGASLVNDGDMLLTHCNAGALATYGKGTAVAVFYHAHEEGKKIHVFADETRPLLQGSRLTVWELQQAQIPVTLICDNMAGWAMAQGKIDKIFVGADRIAANGDTANKIGTYTVATLAKEHKIPFYIVAPTSTIDATLKNGAGIPIEERGAEEIIYGFGKQTAPQHTQVWSPAFDVTPARLIDAIITEDQIYYPPYQF